MGNRKIYRENKDEEQDYLHFDLQAGAERARVPVEETRNSKCLHKKKRNHLSLALSSLIFAVLCVIDWVTEQEIVEHIRDFFPRYKVFKL